MEAVSHKSLSSILAQKGETLCVFLRLTTCAVNAVIAIISCTALLSALSVLSIVDHDVVADTAVNLKTTVKGLCGASGTVYAAETFLNAAGYAIGTTNEGSRIGLITKTGYAVNAILSILSVLPVLSVLSILSVLSMIDHLGGSIFTRNKDATIDCALVTRRTVLSVDALKTSFAL